ncbi:serine-rich adhesin for platelets-like [Palaemon carinicauda]|uniref:serine-rich adhesin for platelets-like n=1 Tax=Palaemon carinicauda TaxID=392227 RepID=UPI0035B5F968
MFGWAKKLTGIFPSQDCEQAPLTKAEIDQEKNTNQDIRQSPDKEGENLILEPGAAPEKRTPSFVKKLPHLLGISNDGRSPSLRMRSRSRSPRLAVTSTHSERAVSDPPENGTRRNSGVSAASSQEKSSNSRTQWYFQSDNELPEKSYLSSEKYVPPDHHDASDRQSTPERYYTPNSSRPTSIKSLNTELSEVNAKPSISEKLFSEVLKGFDKLGDIRSSVFSKDTKNSNMRENSKESNAPGGSKSIGSCSSERVGNTNHKRTKQIEGDVMNAGISNHIQNGKDTENCQTSNSFVNQSGSSKKEFDSNISKSCLLSQPAVKHMVDPSVSRSGDEKNTQDMTQRSTSSSAVSILPETLDDTVFAISSDPAHCVSEHGSSELGVSQKKELSALEQRSKFSTAQKATEKSLVFQTKDFLADNGNIPLSQTIVHDIANEGSSQPNSLEAALLSFEKAVELFPCSSSSSRKTTSHSPSLHSSDSISDFSSGDKQKFTVPSSHTSSTSCPKDEILGASKDMVVPNCLHNIPLGEAQQEFQSRTFSSSYENKLANPSKVCPRDQNPTLQPLICSPWNVPRRLVESSHPTQGNQAKEIIQTTLDFKGKSHNGTLPSFSAESNLQTASHLSHPVKYNESKVTPQSPLSHISHQNDGVQASVPFHGNHMVDVKKSMLPFENYNPKEVDKSSFPLSDVGRSSLSPNQSQSGDDHILIPSNAVHVSQALLNSINSQPKDVSQPTISQKSSELKDGLKCLKGTSHTSFSLPINNQSNIEKHSTIPTQQSERFNEGFPDCNQVKSTSQSPAISIIKQSKDEKQSVPISQSGELKEFSLSSLPTQSYQSNRSHSLLSSQSNKTEEVSQPSPSQSHQPSRGKPSPPQSKETEVINISSLSSQSCQPDGLKPSIHPQSDGTVAAKHSSLVHQSYKLEGFQSSLIVQSEESKTISQPLPLDSHQSDDCQLLLTSQSDEPKSISPSSPPLGQESNGSQASLLPEINEPQNIIQSSPPQSQQPDECQLSLNPQSYEPKSVSLSSPQNNPLNSQSSLPPKSDEPKSLVSSRPPQSPQPDGCQASFTPQSEGSKSTSQSSPPQSHQLDGQSLHPPQSEDPKCVSPLTPLQSHQPDGCQVPLLSQSNEPKSVSPSTPLQSHQPDGCQVPLLSQSDEPKSVSPSTPLQSHQPDGCQVPLLSQSDEPKSVSPSTPLQGHQPDGCQAQLLPQSDEPKSVSPSTPLQSHQPDGRQVPLLSQSNEPKSVSPSTPLQSHQPDACQAPLLPQSDEPKSISPSTPVQSHQPDGCQPQLLPESDEPKSVSPSTSLQSHQPDGCQAPLLPQSNEPKSVSPSTPLQSHQPDGCQALPFPQSDESKGVNPSTPLQSHQPDGCQAPLLPQSDEPKSISPSTTVQSNQPERCQPQLLPQSDEPKSGSPSSSLKSNQPDGCEAQLFPQSDEPKSVIKSTPLQSNQPVGCQAPVPPQSDEHKSVSPSTPLQSHQLDGCQVPRLLSDESQSVSSSSPLQSLQPEGSQTPFSPQSDGTKSIRPSSQPQSHQLDGQPLLLPKIDKPENIGESSSPQSHTPDKCQSLFPSQCNESTSISLSSPSHSQRLDECQPSLPSQSEESKNISHSSPLQILEPGEDEPSIPPHGDKPNCLIKESLVKSNVLKGEGHSSPQSHNDELDLGLISLPSQNDCIDICTLLQTNVSLSSNSLSDKTEDVHQPCELSQNNQQKNSNRSLSSQNIELKNEKQQSSSIFDKQKGATMISLLQDIHLLNKHLHDTVNLPQSSEDKLMDGSNLSLSSKGNKQSEITPLPLISSPSSHIIRIPQCDFIDSEQETTQSPNLSSSSCYKEKHHITELVPNLQDTIQQKSFSTTSVTDSTVQGHRPHSFMNVDNCSKLPLLFGHSDSTHRPFAPSSNSLEVSGNVTQEIFVDSSSTLQPSKNIQTSSLCNRFSLQDRSRHNSGNLDNALNLQEIEGNPNPSENILDKKKSNSHTSTNIQSSNNKLVTPSVQRISEEMGKAELSPSTSCNDTSVKDADLQPHGFEMAKQHMITPPSPKKVPINVAGFVDKKSFAKSDVCQPLGSHHSPFSENELQLERNSFIPYENKLTSVARNSEPLTTSTASLSVCKMNEGTSFDEGASGTLRKVLDTKSIKEKESQNNGQVTEKDICQNLERDSANTSSTLLEGHTANEGILSPMASCQLSHGNVPGLTRRVRSQTSLTTEGCDLQLPQAGENLQPSSRKYFDKNRSASVTKLDEIDKRGNISVVSLTANSKITSSKEDGSLPASPLAPRRKKKCDAASVAQPPMYQQPLSGPVKVIIKGPSTQQDYKTLACKFPPRPPAPSNYNVPLPLASSDVSTSRTDELCDKRIPAEARAPLKTSQNLLPVPKASMKASLNPFDSEEEEEIEPVLKMKTSLNPFDSEEDEEPEPISDMGKVDTLLKKTDKKVSLNPFDSDDDDEKQEQDSTLEAIPHTKNSLPRPGYNPFDEDDDEGEENYEKSPFSHCYRNKPGQMMHTLVSSPYQMRTETLPCNRRPVKPVSLNPFDEEDEDEESSVMAGPFLRVSSLHEQQSKATKSVTLEKEASQLSMPNAEQFIKRKKKRPAPLPPGYGSPNESFALATSVYPERQGMYPRVGSSSSLNEISWRNDSRPFGSTLSLFSSKRKPPPRPPPPKWK